MLFSYSRVVSRRETTCKQCVSVSEWRWENIFEDALTEEQAVSKASDSVRAREREKEKGGEGGGGGGGGVGGGGEYKRAHVCVYVCVCINVCVCARAPACLPLLLFAMSRP